MSSTLAIVIPTMNEEDYLPKLLSSIRKQSLQPQQIIIADAGSQDRTLEIAKEFGATVVSGGMPGAGRNRGAEFATTDLIFFFDSDVELVNQDFLKSAVDEFSKRQLDIATTDVEALNGNSFDVFGHSFYNHYVRLWGRRLPHAPGFCILIKKDLHNRIKGFDETILFAEDHDYVRRAGKIGHFGFLSPDIRIQVSTRRMDRDGRLSVAIKYFLGELHIIFLGPVRHDGFKYSFGHSKHRD